jgi:hypothetical protein
MLSSRHVNSFQQKQEGEKQGRAPTPEPKPQKPHQSPTGPATDAEYDKAPATRGFVFIA